MAALPPLPEKRYWGRFAPDFLSQRAESLQNYLNALCGSSLDVHKTVVTRNFLGVEENIARRRIKDSTNSLVSNNSDSPRSPGGGRLEGPSGMTKSEEEDAARRLAELERKLRSVVDEAERDMISMGREGLGGSGYIAGGKASDKGGEKILGYWEGNDNNASSFGLAERAGVGAVAAGVVPPEVNVEGEKAVAPVEEEIKFDRFQDELVVNLSDM